MPKAPNIVQKEDPVLRGHAKPVPVHDITTPKIKKIISDMCSALASQSDGIALAAPQIGVPLQIFIISGELLTLADKTYTGPQDYLVFINPEISKLSREKHLLEEGCLSVRWLYGHRVRSVRATLRAYNEKGEKIERGASGLLAQIFQHETDHLKGILFTDHAEKVWEMSSEEIAEIQRKNS